MTSSVCRLIVLDPRDVDPPRFAPLRTGRVY
jgi:hypothetical protein